MSWTLAGDGGPCLGAASGGRRPVWLGPTAVTPPTSIFSSPVNTTVCRIMAAKKAGYIPTGAECYCLYNDTNCPIPETQWLRKMTANVAGTPVPLQHPNRLVAVTLRSGRKGRSTVHLRRRRTLEEVIEIETVVLSGKSGGSVYLRNGPAAPSARRRNGPEVQGGGVGGKKW